MNFEALLKPGQTLQCWVVLYIPKAHPWEDKARMAVMQVSDKRDQAWWDTEMSSHGIFLDCVLMTRTLPMNFNAVELELKRTEEEMKTVRAQAQQQIMELEARRQSLLAIGFSGTEVIDIPEVRVKEVKEPFDDIPF